MHGGKSLVLFLYGGELLSDSKLSRTHIIYIGILLTEKIIIILKESCQKIW